MAFENSLDPFKVLIQAAASGEFEGNDQLADVLAESFPAPPEDFEPPADATPGIIGGEALPDILGQLSQASQPNVQSQDSAATGPVNLPQPGVGQLRLPVQPQSSDGLGDVLQGATPDFLTAALPFLDKLLNKGNQPQEKIQGQSSLSELGQIFGG